VSGFLLTPGRAFNFVRFGGKKGCGGKRGFIPFFALRGNVYRKSLGINPEPPRMRRLPKNKFFPQYRKMMRKALIIALEALAYILNTIPEDATDELGETYKILMEAMKRIVKLRETMEKERHAWYKRALGDEKCPCGDCVEEDEENDEEAKDDAIRQAVKLEIGEPEVVYDKSKEIDFFTPCVEVQPPSAKSDTAETPLNTLTTETPTSCVA